MKVDIEVDIEVDHVEGETVFFITPNTLAGCSFFDNFIPANTEYFGRWAVLPLILLSTLLNAFKEHHLTVLTV